MDAPAAELDDRVDHLLLLGLQDPLLAAALHDQAQLLGGDLGLGADVGAERPGDRAGDGRQERRRAGAAARPSTSSGAASVRAKRSGWASASVLGTSSREHDREQRQQDGDDQQGDAVRRARRPRPPRRAGPPAPSVRLTAAKADARKPMNVRPTWLTARKRPGSPGRRWTRRGPGRPRPRAARRGCGGWRPGRSRRPRRTPRAWSGRPGTRISPMGRFTRRRPSGSVRRLRGSGAASGSGGGLGLGARTGRPDLADPRRHADRELARPARPSSPRRRRRSCESSPSVTGARSIVSTPRKTRSPIVVRCLRTPS